MSSLSSEVSTDEIHCVRADSCVSSPSSEVSTDEIHCVRADSLSEQEIVSRTV